MAIKQESLNKLAVLLAEIGDAFAEQTFKSVEAMENSCDKEQFKKAQDLKISANTLTAASSCIRRDYPHLFKGA